MSKPKTRKDVLVYTSNILNEANYKNGRRIAEKILEYFWSCTPMELFTLDHKQVSADEFEKISLLIERSLGGEPIQYILGFEYFKNLSFSVGPGVLIPRPETEELVDKISKYMQFNWGPKNSINIWDLGSGSGCIAISLIKFFSKVKVTAFEGSPKAFEYLTHNVQKLLTPEEQTRLIFLNQSIPVNPEDGVELGEFSAEFTQSVHDFYKSTNAPDLIVSNPPYIAEEDSEIESDVKKFEPAEALFSGKLGLNHLLSWAELAWQRLEMNGIFVAEFGYTQGAQILSQVQKRPWQKVWIETDFDGKDRFLWLRK